MKHCHATDPLLLDSGQAERVNLWCKYQMTEILDDVILGNADVCLLIFDLG